MTHDGRPAPFALYDSREAAKDRPFTENACAEKQVLESGDELLKLFFAEDEPLNPQGKTEKGGADDESSVYQLDDAHYITEFSKDN